jgi:hypothetical protein
MAGGRTAEIPAAARWSMRGQEPTSRAYRLFTGDLDAGHNLNDV